MHKLGIFLIIFVSLIFFSFNEKVEAAAVPISENELDEYDIERFIDDIKEGNDSGGVHFSANVWGKKFYKDKGVLYWTANFGQNKNSFIKFKLNNKNYVDWATITRYMPKPTKNSWQEYRMETSTAAIEFGAIWEPLIERIVGFYDDYGKLAQPFGNEIGLALQKIFEQVEEGKTIEPYDHTSSVYISEVDKTFNVRVYWSESLIYVGLSASK